MMTETLIHDGKLIDCWPESDFKIWINDLRLWKQEQKIWVDQTIQFRGWECVVFSATYHADPFAIELLLRRERKHTD